MDTTEIWETKLSVHTFCSCKGHWTGYRKEKLLLRRKENKEMSLLFPHFRGCTSFKLAEWRTLNSHPLTPSPEK